MQGITLTMAVQIHVFLPLTYSVMRFLNFMIAADCAILYFEISLSDALGMIFFTRPVGWPSAGSGTCSLTHSVHDNAWRYMVMIYHEWNSFSAIRLKNSDMMFSHVFAIKNTHGHIDTPSYLAPVSAFEGFIRCITSISAPPSQPANIPDSCIHVYIYKRDVYA